MKVFNRNVKRIDRLYFWIAWITALIIGYILETVWFAVWQSWGYNVWFYVIAGLNVLLLVYRFLLSSKRFHDAGYGTGYYVLCVLLSFILVGIGMWFLVAIKDTASDRKWGENLQEEV